MATMPMQSMMPGGTPDAETAPEQQGEPLKSVTIELQSDGTFLVGTEPSGPDAEGMGEMAQDTAGGMQPAATIDEALQLAKTLLSQDEGMSPEQAFQGGFKGTKVY